MNSKWLKGVLPPLVIAISTLIFITVEATAKREPEEKTVNTAPLVKVESAVASSYQVAITAHGVVEPMEVTPLGAQVSGEVSFRSENFIDGGIVKSGELLFSIEKDAYSAAVLQAEANLNSARANFIDQQAQADVAKDEARRNPQKTYTDLFLRKPQVLSATADVKSAEATLKLAQRDLDNCDVYAPFDALIVNKSLGLGQYLSVGVEVATLYNIESAKVVVPIPGFESIFLPENIVGVGTELQSKSLLGVTRQGRVVHDLGIVDSATRMSQLLIKVSDPYGLQNRLPALKFGSFVEVSIPGATLSNVYKLPQELVNNRTVWVVNEDSKLEPRKVDVVREEDGFFYVRSGLTNHDQVVTTPPEYPQKGMLVKVINSDDVTVSAASVTY